LKVEEVRECYSWEEKEKDKVEKLASLSRGPCSPFYQTRGQVTLVKGRGVVHA
jgi:hypothetical protein